MTQDSFFARQNYIELLEKRVSALKDGYRQNIAVIGDELVGKTSLIFHFLKKFCDNRIIMLYLEVRPESLETFAQRFIGVLLYNFLINSGIGLQENLGFLLEKSEKYLPKTAEKIKEILYCLKKRKKHNIFAELLSLPEMVNKETGKSCVIILDEFHNLENVGIKQLYPSWSKLLVLQKNTMYILVSSLKSKAKAVLSKNLNLLFGNFEIVTVEPFDTNTSAAYLKRLLGSNIADSDKRDFIMHFTGGNPFYLGLVARELLKNPQAELTDILEDLLFSPSGILNQRFSNYLRRFLDTHQSQDYITILYLIAGGHNRIKDLSHLLRRQKKETVAKTNLLMELDTVSRSGDFFKINDRVFSFWLRFVYQEKLQSLTFDARNQKEVFRQKIESMLSEFFTSSHKPLFERATEMLRLFEDDTVQFEKKKFKLTHFREIKPVEFCSRRLREGLLGRASDDLWIIGFKYDSLTEEDISEFVKECKKYRHKQQRKIIITVREIDANTRLKALEEKIWTWNVENLNQILDLYTKPRIIIQQDLCCESA